MAARRIGRTGGTFVIAAHQRVRPLASSIAPSSCCRSISLSAR